MAPGTPAPPSLATRNACLSAVSLPLAVTVAAVGAASGAFCYLSGGNMLEVVAAITGSSVGQWLRSLLVRRRFNQYAVTTLCAMVASGVYCLIAAVWTGAGFALPRHAPGFISSVLFLFPGFPLVAGLNDLLQHQTVAGMSRLTYGAMVVMSAAFGLGLVASAVGLTTAPGGCPPEPGHRERARETRWRSTGGGIHPDSARRESRRHQPR